MATYSSIRYNFAPPDATTSSQIGAGAMKLIKTLTADESATLSFVDGTSGVVLDNTYKTYLFKLIEIHAETHQADFTVGFRDGSTDYDATKTTSTYYGYHDEGDTATGLQYDTGHDMAQGTGFCQLGGDAMGTGNDECMSGYMYLFNPSQTTYIKHFLAVTNTLTEADYSVNEFTGGYCNVTAAIDAVQFKMSSGNIDSGTIKLYGIA